MLTMESFPTSPKINDPTLLCPSTRPYVPQQNRSPEISTASAGCSVSMVANNLYPIIPFIFMDPVAKTFDQILTLFSSKEDEHNWESFDRSLSTITSLLKTPKLPGLSNFLRD